MFEEDRASAVEANLAEMPDHLIRLPRTEVRLDRVGVGAEHRAAVDGQVRNGESDTSRGISAVVTSVGLTAFTWITLYLPLAAEHLSAMVQNGGGVRAQGLVSATNPLR
jgi:hypothetical protein